MDKGATDDTRKSPTPNSSMMGRPDQWHQPEKSLDGEISSRAKQVGRDLRSSRLEQNLVLRKLYSLLIGHHTSLRNRQNWWEPLPTTIRSIRPNDTVSKRYGIKNSYNDYFRNRWLTWREMIVPWECYKSIDLRKGRHTNTFLTFRITKILTLSSEVSWPASTGLFWLYCLSFRICQRPFDR